MDPVFRGPCFSVLAITRVEFHLFEESLKLLAASSFQGASFQAHVESDFSMGKRGGAEGCGGVVVGGRGGEEMFDPFFDMLG